MSSCIQSADLKSYLVEKIHNIPWDCPVKYVYLIHSKVCMGHVDPKGHSGEDLRVVQGDEGGAELANVRQNASFPVGSAGKHQHY